MGKRYSGQITVTTAGTEVQGPDVGAGTFLLQRDPANTGTYAYVGNNGDDTVSSTTGFKLGAGDKVAVTVENLNKLWFDGDANGDKVDWIRMDNASS